MKVCVSAIALLLVAAFLHPLYAATESRMLRIAVAAPAISVIFTCAPARGMRDQEPVCARAMWASRRSSSTNEAVQDARYGDLPLGKPSIGRGREAIVI